MRRLVAALAGLAARFRERFAPAGPPHVQVQRAEAVAPDADLVRRVMETALVAEPERRRNALRSALAMAERLPGADADALVAEISLHLAEGLRGDGAFDEALPHYARALQRTGDATDGPSRARRAGVLARIGVLEQQAGRPEQARSHYEAALATGAPEDSADARILLTQAAFNLGLLAHEQGRVEEAHAHWQHAVELGTSADGPGGWDPAAIASFNLGHQEVAAGDLPSARAWFARALELGEPAGTPVGLLAACKAAFALAQLEEGASAFIGGTAVAMLERAAAVGRASGLPEALAMAAQAELQLGEWRTVTEPAAALRHYRAAADLAREADPTEIGALVSYAPLRLGMAMSEAGDREAALAPLAEAVERGRAAGDERSLEIAAQAACNLHRVLCAMERWPDAERAITSALALTAELPSGLGRALEAAAAYGLAVQRHHEQRDGEALESLRRAARLGRESAVEPGEQVTADALLMAGNLAMTSQRPEEAAALFREALDAAGGAPSPERRARAAQAATHLGHALLALQRPADACEAYDRAIALGRAAGRREGRAAAANAALNRASLALDLAVAQRRELWMLAITLGRASGTALGADVAAKAEAAMNAVGEE